MHEPDPRTVALVGPGRAGTTVVGALRDAGWTVVGVAGRTAGAASARAVAESFGTTSGSAADVVRGAALVVIATPDAAIAAVAGAIAGSVHPDTLVVHLAGSLGTEVLSGLACRTGALHPLQTLPSVELGRARLRGSAAAVVGDPALAALARDLGLEPFAVDDAERARYHAAACVASNHLVALLAHAEACTTVPLAAFLPLVRATVENVAAVGPGPALTGPVARGDVRHRSPSSGRDPGGRAGRVRRHGATCRARRRSARGSRRRARMRQVARIGEVRAAATRRVRPVRPSGSCRRWGTSTPGTCRS